MATVVAARAPHESDRRAAFETLQDQPLAHDRVCATARYLTLSEPAFQLHVVQAGPEDADPVLIVRGGDRHLISGTGLIGD